MALPDADGTFNELADACFVGGIEGNRTHLFGRRVSTVSHAA